MGDDLTGGQALRGQRDHQIVQRARAPRVLRQHLRPEGAQPVPGHLHRHGADLGYHLLTPVPVSHVAPGPRPAPAGPAGLRVQVRIHLGLQRGLQQMLGQLGQDPALAHQPQPLAVADLLGSQHRQLVQQRQTQPIRREIRPRRPHVGTLDAPPSPPASDTPPAASIE
jgi:hypothetical protein